MANKLTFKRNPKSGYIISSFYASDGRIEVSIGIKVTELEYKAMSNDKASKRMSRLSYLVDKFAESKERSGDPVKKQEIQDIIKEELGKKKEVTASGLLVDDLERYRKMIEDGEILNEGKKLSTAYDSQIKGILKALRASPKTAKIRTAEFDIHDHGLFKTAMLASVSQNSMSVYNTQLITFFRVTRDLGWHNNMWDLLNKRIRIKKEKTEGDIPLLAEELDKLRKVDTEGEIEEFVRDLFLLGCNIGLRHSDISELDKATVKNGILRKFMKKTSKFVEVPMNTEARRIWVKYDGIFPVIQLSKFNTTIKRLCKRAEINEMCLYVYTKEGKSQQEMIPKHDMVSSHTMRRTFANSLLESNVDLFDIKELLGHSKVEQTIEYLWLAKKQVAGRAKKNSFFQ